MKGPCQAMAPDKNRKLRLEATDVILYLVVNFSSHPKLKRQQTLCAEDLRLKEEKEAREKFDEILAFCKVVRSTFDQMFAPLYHKYHRRLYF